MGLIIELTPQLMISKIRNSQFKLLESQT